MDPKYTCEECFFWHYDKPMDPGPTVRIDDPERLLGECRRFAPQPLHRATFDAMPPRHGVWPVTHCEDWCGEFKRMNGYE